MLSLYRKHEGGEMPPLSAFINRGSGENIKLYWNGSAISTQILFPAVWLTQWMAFWWVSVQCWLRFLLTRSHRGTKGCIQMWRKKATAEAELGQLHSLRSVCSYRVELQTQSQWKEFIVWLFFLLSHGPTTRKDKCYTMKLTTVSSTLPWPEDPMSWMMTISK